MDLLAHLNSQQRQAVTAAPGPVLVMAGPGSGKTRVLAHRVAYLIGHLGVPAYRIAAVTFTNKAAREMRQRVEGLLGGGLRGLTLGTFHSICARLLRREAASLPVSADFVIYDESDQQAIIKRVLKELNLDDKQFRPGAVLGAISKAKNELIGPEEFAASSYFAEVAGRVYRRYQELLVQNDALDFDDLLMQVVVLFDKQPEALARVQRQFEHVLVDEFQDTNTAQVALLRRLVAPHRCLYCVGDPDQSIYRWRGADYRNVHRFQQDYPEAVTVLLEQNYRSTQTVLDAATAVIDKNPGRTRKALFTDRGPGPKLFAHEAYDEHDEAQWVLETIASLVSQGLATPGDCAVMYRTNAQSRVVEEAFLRANLPYRLVGAQRFYGRREVKDLLAYLRVVHNPADSVSLMRVLSVPPRGIGAKTVEALQAAASQSGIGPAQVLLELGQAGRPEFPGRAGTALADFGRRLAEWSQAKEQLSVVDLLDRVLTDVSYRGYLEDGTEEGEERWANVVELRAVAAEADEADLTGFLEGIALVSDQDTLKDDVPAPTLLTLHAAKGLEFPVVFLIGLDDGLLPHQRSFDEPEEMAEERRLMYVGLTRAKDRVFLVRAFRRSVGGDSGISMPSRFLEDIPADLVDGALTRRHTLAEAVYERATAWDTSAAVTAPVREAQFRSGIRVKHSLFGEGIVLESRLTGGEEEVTVVFDDVGVKRLMAEVAKLHILEG